MLVPSLSGKLDSYDETGSWQRNLDVGRNDDYDIYLIVLPLKAREQPVS